MPLYCSRFIFAPCKQTLGDVIPDYSTRMFRRCWRKLWLPGRLCSSSVPTSPDSDFKNLEMSTQNEKPFHTPVMVKEVLQFLDIKPGQGVLATVKKQYKDRLSPKELWQCLQDSSRHTCKAT